MNPWVYSIPAVSAVAGWLFNKLCGYYILNTWLPRYKMQLISAASEKAAGMLPFDKLEKKIASPELIEKSMPVIEKHIDEFFEIKLPQEIPMLSMFIGNKMTGTIKEVFIKHLKLLFPAVMAEILNGAKKDFDIQNILTNELNKPELASYLKENLKIPLKKINNAGLASGFIIGCINLLIYRLLS